MPTFNGEEGKQKKKKKKKSKQESKEKCCFAWVTQKKFSIITEISKTNN